MLSIVLMFAMAVAPEARFEELAQVGKQVDGTVKQVAKYGAFVDLGGGIDGFLHVDDMSWSGETDPAKLVKVGQKLTAKVIEVDREKKRLALSIRRDEDDPWKTAADRYKPGTRAKGKVVNVMELGVFFRLEPHVDVLVHYSDLPSGKKTSDYALGQVHELMVTKVDTERRRIGGTIR